VKNIIKIILILLFVNVIDGAINYTSTNIVKKRVLSIYSNTTDIYLFFTVNYRSYSLFQFENHNGRLANYVTGYRKVAAQIINRNSIYKHLQIEGIFFRYYLDQRFYRSFKCNIILLASLTPLSLAVSTYFEELLSVRRTYCIHVRCWNKAVACGKGKNYVFQEADVRHLQLCDVDVTTKKAKCYPHVFINGTKYDATNAKTENKFNNSFCQVSNVGIFSIQKIVVVENVCFLKCYKLRMSVAKNISPNLHLYLGESKKAFWIYANKVTKQTYILMRKNDKSLQYLFEVPNCCEFE